MNHPVHFIYRIDRISDEPFGQSGDTTGAIRIRQISDGSPDIRIDRIRSISLVLPAQLKIWNRFQ